MKKILFVLMAVALLSVPGTVFAADYDPIDDPTAGTLIGYLAPGQNGPEDAEGRGVINYAADEDVFEVQVNVVGLDPNTEYSLYLHKDGGEWVFTTNEGGNGSLHVETETLGAFDRMNIRTPWLGNSGVLSTAAEGGSLRQVPSNR